MLFLLLTAYFSIATSVAADRQYVQALLTGRHMVDEMTKEALLEQTLANCQFPGIEFLSHNFFETFLQHPNVVKLSSLCKSMLYASYQKLLSPVKKDSHECRQHVEECKHQNFLLETYESELAKNGIHFNSPGELDPQACKRLTRDRQSVPVKRFAGVSSAYTLTRLNKNTFIATINYKYSFEKTNPLGVLLDEMEKAFQFYLHSAQQCLDRYNPDLKGPNGEQLLIQLQQFHPVSPPPPEKELSIALEKIRETMSRWNIVTDCPTVLHEALHALGLVDEYEETTIKETSTNLNAYNCRVRGPEDSIMRSLAALNAYKKAGRNSILYPAQFRVITEPGCSDVNHIYYGCAQLAYAPSVNQDGEERCPTSIPLPCLDESTFSWLQ